jgi:hypothetical protein
VAEVVLDENIYIRGIEAECSALDARPTNERAARLVVAIQQRHQWIASPGIARAYLQAVDYPNRCKQPIANQMIKSFNDVLADTERSIWLEQDQLLDIPGDYDPNDRHMVRAAAARTGCYLTTMDTELVRQLARLRIPEERGFIVIGLDEAETILV